MTTQTAAPTLPVVPPFTVASRAKAQKLAKLLYGPTGRCFKIAATQVAIGFCLGGEPTHVTKGASYTEALNLPIESYLKGGKDYKDTIKRFAAVAPHAEVQEFVEPALKQFPEYEAMLRAQRAARDPGTIVAKLLAKAKAQNDAKEEAAKLAKEKNETLLGLQEKLGGPNMALPILGRSVVVVEGRMDALRAAVANRPELDGKVIVVG